MKRLEEIRERLEAAKYFNPDPDQEMQEEGFHSARGFVVWTDDDEYTLTCSEESTAKFLCNAKSDIEWLLKQLDMLEDSMVVYKLERPATDGVKDDMISKIADRAVNVSPEDAADFIRTGTSRHDWFGEGDA